MKEIVFLCGARDFHAMDWYRSALKVANDQPVTLLTDLIAGEGFEKLITSEDKVEKLLIIDPFLFRHQSGWGDKWRNLIKLVVMPLQVRKLKAHARRHPNAVYLAHSMYYLFLAEAAGVPFIGTPQGSDILIKPYRSEWYRRQAVKALQAAEHITVDSVKMQEKISELAGVSAHIVQNGIDVSAIKAHAAQMPDTDKKWNISIRGLTPLYRIREIVQARNTALEYGKENLTLIYPFYEKNYKEEVEALLKPDDNNLGRIDKSLFYDYFLRARVIFSIPVSDSSPKSVYEGIFSGAAVVITHHPYYDILPAVMQQRIIIIDPADAQWFDTAMKKANEITRTPFIPDQASLEMFDKDESFRKILKLINN